MDYIAWTYAVHWECHSGLGTEQGTRQRGSANTAMGERQTGVQAELLGKQERALCRA